MNKSYFVVFLVIALALFSHDTKAQWVQTNNPSVTGGLVSFAISGNNIFGASPDSGVFLSTDSGSNWNGVNNGLTKKIRALAIGGNSNIFAAGDSGVFLSTNNGSSWTAANTGLPADVFTTLAISGNSIFVGTAANGVFLSTNNGSSWTAANSGMTNASVYSLAIIGENNYIFAGTGDGSGVFLSTNNGSSWTAVNNGLTDPYVAALAISGNNIFVGTGSGVFLSTNNGTNWTAVNSGLPGVAGREVSALGINGNNIFVGSNDVYISTNNGSSWTAVHNGLPTGLAVNTFAFSGNITFVALDGWSKVLFLSTDNGSNWNGVNNNALGRNEYVFSLAAKPNGTGGNNIFAGGRFTGPFLSTDNGSSWSAVSNALPKSTFIRTLAISGNNIFAGSDNVFAAPANNGVFLSTNNGASWTAVVTGLTNRFVDDLAISGDNIFAGTAGGVFLSTNNGSSWTVVNNGLTNMFVKALAISGNNIFAGTAGGGVFLSTDNGSNWSAVNNGLTSLSVWRLAVTGANSIYAGTLNGGVFRSDNNGSSWTAVNNGLPAGASIYSFATIGENIFAGPFAGGIGGVFLSTDKGSNWNSVNTGLPLRPVWAFTVSGDNIFAGLEGGGVWRRPLSEVFPPQAPALASPANGAAGVSTSPTLNWNASAGALSYRLQVSVDSSFTSPVVDQSGITDTSHAVTGLAYITPYYWRVSAMNAGGTSAWSSVWSFTTIPAPTFPPQLLSIRDVPNDQGGRVTVKWAASVLDTNVATLPFYSIWRALPATQTAGRPEGGVAAGKVVSMRDIKIDFEGPAYRTETLNNITYVWEWIANQPAHRFALYTYAAATLYDSSSRTDGKHYFLVSAHTSNPNVFYDSNPDSGYSVDNLPPLAPAYVAGSRVGTTAVIHWNANTESDLAGYKVYRSRVSGFNPDTMMAYAATNDTSYTDANVPQTNNWYYALLAVDVHENRSAKSNEVAIIVLGVDDVSGAPRVFALLQNYPNPFNPSTEIKFSVENTSRATLEIYSVLGQKVATLFDDVAETGQYYKVRLDGSSLSSGIYFYRLRSGGKSGLKKMILLK